MGRGSDTPVGMGFPHSLLSHARDYDGAHQEAGSYSRGRMGGSTAHVEEGHGHGSVWLVGTV